MSHLDRFELGVWEVLVASCDRCGGEIVFRRLGGNVTPIHLSGSGCTGSRMGATQRSYGEYFSYINPNAHCPVCGEAVFFYQSATGGRVFFDALGWPWPKHPCTDDTRAQINKVKISRKNISNVFKSRSGQLLLVYILDSLSEKKSILYIRFKNTERGSTFYYVIEAASLKKLDISVADLRDAPSFVVHRIGESRIIEFISARKKTIDGFKASKLSLWAESIH